MRTKCILGIHTSADHYGSDLVMLKVIKALTNKGYSFIVILPYRGPLSEKIEEIGVKVLIRNTAAFRRRYMTPFGLVNRLVRMISFYRFLKVLIQEQHIDCIYSNSANTWVGGFIARKNGIPHVWHIHETTIRPKSYVKWVGWILSRYSNLVIAVSQGVADHWSQFVNSSQIEVIYNGFELPKPDQFQQHPSTTSFTKDHCVIAMVGRITPLKGQHYFVEIAEKLVQMGDDYRFLIVGDTFKGQVHFERELRELIHSKKLVDRVILTGFVENIPSLLSQINVLVHPSVLPDSLPSVIIEAMSVSKPVVATDLGGAREIVDDNKTGILIPIDDAARSAELIHQLVLDTHRMIEFGRAGRSRVERMFEQRLFDKKIGDTFDQLLGE